ncbi:hypothetical protein EV361DRAFT_84722 [Lentinula raphanica]|nr:hypothetical protein EV361DRAFT_84722 [Lentinula raphanica]
MTPVFRKAALMLASSVLRAPNDHGPSSSSSSLGRRSQHPALDRHAYCETGIQQPRYCVRVHIQGTRVCSATHDHLLVVVDVVHWLLFLSLSRSFESTHSQSLHRYTPSLSIQACWNHWIVLIPLCLITLALVNNCRRN